MQGAGALSSLAQDRLLRFRGVQLRAPGRTDRRGLLEEAQLVARVLDREELGSGRVGDPVRAVVVSELGAGALEDDGRDGLRVRLGDGAEGLGGKVGFRGAAGEEVEGGTDEEEDVEGCAGGPLDRKSVV